MESSSTFSVDLPDLPDLPLFPGILGFDEKELLSHLSALVDSITNGAPFLPPMMFDRQEETNADNNGSDIPLLPPPLPVMNTVNPESEVESKVESKVESEPKSEPESEPESKVESEPKSEPKSEPESEVESEVESEPESEPESEAESETKEENKETPQIKVTGKRPRLTIQVSPKDNETPSPSKASKVNENSSPSPFK